MKCACIFLFMLNSCSKSEESWDRVMELDKGSRKSYLPNPHLGRAISFSLTSRGIGCGMISGRGGVGISCGRRHAESGKSRNRSGSKPTAADGSCEINTWTVNCDGMDLGAAICERS